MVIDSTGFICNLYEFDMGRDEDEITLFRLSIDVVVRHPERLTVENVHALPESITIQLFESLLTAGKMNPRLLVLFERIDCLEIEERIQMLGISSWIPPMVEGHHSCTLQRRYA